MSESSKNLKSPSKKLLKQVSQLFTHGGKAPQSGIPENILAFRTITTLLERIQQHKPFKLLQDVQDPQQELKLSTAFSTVAVINHEVVAVVAKRMPEMLEVIVGTNISPDQNQQVITQSPALNSIFPDFSSFLFVKNFRRDDLKSAEPQKTPDKQIRDPVINAIQPPPDLAPNPGYEELKQYIKKR